MYPSFSLSLPIISLLFSLSFFELSSSQNLPASQCSINSSLPSNLTNAIPAFLLPTSYSTASRPNQDLIAELQIHNTLSLYPFAVDGKNFAALDRVFSSDVIANYSAPLGVLTPLVAVQAALNESLFPVTTQHSLGTQVIDVLEGSCEARSVTYYTATHFGQGVYYGEVLYAYGQYQDTWVKNVQTEEWRIQTRTLVNMGPLIGNFSIFTPST